MKFIIIGKPNRLKILGEKINLFNNKGRAIKKLKGYRKNNPYWTYELFEKMNI